MAAAGLGDVVLGAAALGLADLVAFGLVAFGGALEVAAIASVAGSLWAFLLAAGEAAGAAAAAGAATAAVEATVDFLEARAAGFPFDASAALANFGCVAALAFATAVFEVALPAVNVAAFALDALVAALGAALGALGAVCALVALTALGAALETAFGTALDFLEVALVAVLVTVRAILRGLAAAGCKSSPYVNVSTPCMTVDPSWVGADRGATPFLMAVLDRKTVTRRGRNTGRDARDLPQFPESTVPTMLPHFLKGR